MKTRRYFGSRQRGLCAVLGGSLWLGSLADGGSGPGAARVAKAEATVEGGHVVDLKLTDPGAGYGVPPTVTLDGGGGSGATAVAQVRNGSVETLRLTTTGAGYTSVPTVVVEAPAEPMLASVQRHLRLTIRGQPGEAHQILAKDQLTLTEPWEICTNLVVAQSTYTWEDVAGSSTRFYRLAGNLQPPSIASAELRVGLRIVGTAGATHWILGTELGRPHVWQILAEVVAPGSVYEWVDAEVRTLERRYQVAAAPALPVEMDPRLWAWIQPGRFAMGSPADERGRSSVEGPETLVTLTRGFWLGRCEVTQREYLAIMGSNPSFHHGDLDLPVESVSWHDATNYCAKLTVAERNAGRLPTGYEYRLPTEAQWEYACRAGTTTRYSFGEGFDCDDGCGACAPAARYMWWCGNSREQCQPVGQTLPNPWGLYDLHGNVYEWCQDWWLASLPGGSVTDPTGPASGSDRVLRGGSWYDPGQYCRSAARGGNWPRIGSNVLGFRAALVPVP